MYACKLHCRLRNARSIIWIQGTMIRAFHHVIYSPYWILNSKVAKLEEPRASSYVLSHSTIVVKRPSTVSYSARMWRLTKPITKLRWNRGNGCPDNVGLIFLPVIAWSHLCASITHLPLALPLLWITKVLSLSLSLCKWVNNHSFFIRNVFMLISQTVMDVIDVT